MQFFLTSPTSLFESQADGAGGGSAAATLDAGAPFEHGEQPKPAKQTEKSDVEKRFEALETDLAGARRERDEARESERYWAERARGGRDREDAAGEQEESDPDPEVRPRGAEAEEKPEALLDDLSVKGLKALEARGVITAEELDRRMRALEEKTERRIQAAEADATWASKFAQEFPEISADNARVNRGQKPETELFRRAGEIFREMVGDDPSVKNSQGALVAAARAAKRELAAEAKAMERDNRDRQDDRRSRIDAQRPERDRGGQGDDDGAPRVSKLSQQVISNLARFGVTQEAYEDHMGPRNSKGMEHKGGARGR